MFAWVRGLAPTKNAAVRGLRPVVSKRKRPFGCHSAAGCHFTERPLSVTAPLGLGRLLFDYLVDALVAHRHCLPAPAQPAALLTSAGRIHAPDHRS
jgi:hypothetical protein